jgi:hypothetical protein
LMFEFRLITNPLLYIAKLSLSPKSILILTCELWRIIYFQVISRLIVKLAVF